MLGDGGKVGWPGAASLVLVPNAVELSPYAGYEYELSPAGRLYDEAGRLDSGAPTDEVEGASDEAGATADDGAGASDGFGESSPPVGVSPSRTQPVLSVSALGHVTCL